MGQVLGQQGTSLITVEKQQVEAGDRAAALSSQTCPSLMSRPLPVLLSLSCQGYVSKKGMYISKRACFRDIYLYTRDALCIGKSPPESPYTPRIGL